MLTFTNTMALAIGVLGIIERSLAANGLDPKRQISGCRHNFHRAEEGHDPTVMRKPHLPLSQWAWKWQRGDHQLTVMLTLSYDDGNHTNCMAIVSLKVASLKEGLEFSWTSGEYRNDQLVIDRPEETPRAMTHLFEQLHDLHVKGTVRREQFGQAFSRAIAHFNQQPIESRSAA